MKCRSTFVRRDLLLRHDRTVHAKDGGVPLQSDSKRKNNNAGKASPTAAPQTKLPELDKGMGTLVEDLAQRGLLENTMVVWMGDFGRTPRINQNGGRDHWPRSWSVVMGGGGMKGGQVIGASDGRA